MTLLMSTMLHLLLVDGTLWLVHHLDPRVNVRCSWKKKSGLSPTKIFIVIIIIVIIVIIIAIIIIAIIIIIITIIVIIIVIPWLCIIIVATTSII